MKQNLRGALGPVYPLLIRLKTSSLARSGKAGVGCIPYLVERRMRPGVLAVDINARIGMGAILSWALRYYALAEAHGEKADIVSTSPLYSANGEDMFARFFERPSSGGRMLGRLASEWLAVRTPLRLPLSRAEALFAEHFRPNAYLRQKIEAAAGGEPFDLSIHFRGTDKFLESGSVDQANMLATVERHLPRDAKTVFLATDEPGFSSAVRSRFPHVRFVSYDLGDVKEGVARHFSSMDPNEKALEALVNIFLLARAPVCVRTSSFLSAVSRVANPQLRTVTINRTKRGNGRFPEYETLTAEAVAAAKI